MLTLAGRGPAKSAGSSSWLLRPGSWVAAGGKLLGMAACCIAENQRSCIRLELGRKGREYVSYPLVFVYSVETRCGSVEWLR